MAERCEFTENRAGDALPSATTGPHTAGYGGAVRTKVGTFRGVTFLRNSAGINPVLGQQQGYAGAVMALEPTTFTNCLLAGNSAPGAGSSASGGAIVAVQLLGLTNCTLTQNSAPSGVGGGIVLQHATNGLHADNCIFWANFDAGGTADSEPGR